MGIVSDVVEKGWKMRPQSECFVVLGGGGVEVAREVFTTIDFGFR